jgi:hypothetical protein
LDLDYTIPGLAHTVVTTRSSQIKKSTQAHSLVRLRIPHQCLHLALGIAMKIPELTHPHPGRKGVAKGHQYVLRAQNVVGKVAHFVSCPFYTNDGFS